MKIIKNNPNYYTSIGNIRVLLFLGPQSPAPGLIYFFTTPNDGITFSRPPSIKNYLFTALLIIVCHVFFYSFKQNSAYNLFENSSHQNVLSYTNQLHCESIGCFLYDANWKLLLNWLEIYKPNNFCRNNVKKYIF